MASINKRSELLLTFVTLGVGDLKTAGPKVKDSMRNILSLLGILKLGFQLMPISCIAFEACVTITCIYVNYLKVRILI